MAIRHNIFGPVLSFGFEVLELISVKHRACFYGFEIKRAGYVPEGHSLLGHAVLGPEVLAQES